MLALSASLPLAAAGQNGGAFTEAEIRTIASLSLAALPPLPADPGNRVADDPDAAALGATLFFDQRLSRDGTVSCSTCHQIDRQFQDDLPRARGLGVTNRRTMPLAGVAWGTWFFWDGRRDSLWAQALSPLENPVEHGGTRAGYAHFIAGNFRDRYERIFGPLPDLDGVPAEAGPFGDASERAAWDALPAERRDRVNSVFANIGKAIAAFERAIAPRPTRFDRLAASLAGGAPEGEGVFLDEEMHGLRLFMGKAGCIACHNGPRLTDDRFHNTGVPAVAGLPQDLGRETGVLEALSDPFNCAGRYSDAGPGACGDLRSATSGLQLRRAFKTPSLRGAASRPPYMHAGQIATLEAVLDHYAAAPASADGVSELVPINLSEQERAALAAFLKTLD